MKLSGKIIHIGLASLVLLSFYFSFNIWVNSSRKFDVPKDASTLINTNERNQEDVFLPLRLIFYQNDKSEMSNNENLMMSIQKKMHNATFGSLTKTVIDSASNFSTQIQLNNGIELLYEGQYSIAEYSKIYKLELTIPRQLEKEDLFNQIQLDFKKQEIRFLNFETKTMYTASMFCDVEEILKLLNKEETQFYPVSKKVNKNLGVHYYLVENTRLKKYSYILASQPVARFKSAFFQQLDTIHTNTDSQDLVYTRENESLTIGEALGTVQYRGEVATLSKKQTIYSESFPFIKRLGTSMGNLHFFDCSQNTIDYRTFVEGYPVFNKYNKGQVQMNIQNITSKKPQIIIDTSVDTIQVPIPSEEEVTLENTDVLLTEILQAGGNESAIQSMLIGYTWQTIKETKQVVDLTPEWYIKYEDSWYSKEDLLKYLSD